jgi:ketosteroid isomerase-like protein
MVDSRFWRHEPRRFHRQRRGRIAVGATADGAVEVRGEMVFPDRVYRNDYHNLLVIQDGQILSGREYMDTRAAAEAFAP